MGFNLISSIEEFARLKQINRKKIAEIIKESLQSTLEKRLPYSEEVNVEIDFEKGNIIAEFQAKVVEEPQQYLSEISLENAQKEFPKVEVGDEIPRSVPITEFGRKTIQAARQSIINKINESVNKKMKVDYEKQKGEIISGVVKKVEYNGYVVDIGFTTALLPAEEQVENEFYKASDYIKAYIYDIRPEKGKMTVILSRRRPEFIVKLFQSEIPEIADGDVVIKKIVREPGYRTKVAVYSENENVDPYGSCIGKKGARIQDIKKELHDEQVDVVKYEENPEQFVKNSIGASLVDKVYLADRGRFAQVIVNEKNKNIAIGKGGKNVKLAAKLTNFKIDVLLEEEYEEMAAYERRVTSQVYSLEGVTEKIGKILFEAGYTSVQDVYESSVDELCNISGIGKKTAEKIKKSAENF
ncbi:MAG: transcription termination factor NusA [Candidatus Cloacimonetes bacterium]|nr:transcription termination factor NusA [Candidatus Cloacimonadota bacterium]MBS3768134.1 transcription termination factor NusA [Candidatus Cloacimonadota bacterium]